MQRLSADNNNNKNPNKNKRINLTAKLLYLSKQGNTVAESYMRIHGFDITLISRARFQKVLSEGGPTLTTFLCYFCFVMRGKRIQIALKESYHRLASEAPFKWRFAGAR